MVCGVSALSLLISNPAHALTATWDGGGGNANFSTAANWAGDVTPTPGTATDYIFTGNINLSANIDTYSSTSTWTAQSITFDSAAGAFNIGPSNGQTVNRFAMSNGSTIVQNSANNETIAATIALNGTTSVSGTGAGSLTLGSVRIGTSGSLLNLGRNNVIIGTISTATASWGTVRVLPGVTTTFSAANTGTLGALNFNVDAGGAAGSSASTIIATNAGGFTSSAAISSSDVTFGGSVAMNFTGAFTLLGNAAKTITFNNTGGTTLSGSTIQLGAVNGTGARTVTMTVGGTASALISGALVSNASTGLTSVLKNGSGTLTFSGANTYTGDTVVSVGTLLANTAVSGTNSATGAGTVSVSATGTLGGIGQITPGAGKQITVANGGTMAPGDAGIGTLTVNGANTTSAVLSLATGANFAFELNSTGSGNFQSDKIALLNGAANDFVFGGSNVINFTDLSGGSLAHGAYILFTADAASAYSGFENLSIGTGLDAYAGSTLQLSGNDIILYVVPEPTTWAQLAIGLTMVIVLRRRRNS